MLDGLFNWAIARNIMNYNPLPTDKPNRPQGFLPYIYKREELKKIIDKSMTYRSFYTTFYPETIRGIIMADLSLGA